MEAGQWWFKALWRPPLATFALYGALVVHLALALTSLYRRHHLRMPVWEATQMALGLTIPVLLFSHLIGTRLAAETYGVNDSYSRVVLILWAVNPQAGARQVLVMAIAWAHGCMGLHFWLRLRPWSRESSPRSSPSRCFCPCSPPSASSPPAARRRPGRPIPPAARSCCGPGGRR